MNKDHFSQAKQSIVLFLKSLPKDSLFNIIIFGSDFKRMFKVSHPYND